MDKREASEIEGNSIERISTSNTFVQTPSSETNFPIKSFYSEENQECYTFYRQGQGFVCNALDPCVSNIQKISNEAFGSMFMLYG